MRERTDLQPDGLDVAWTPEELARYREIRAEIMAGPPRTLSHGIVGPDGRYLKRGGHGTCRTSRT